MRHISVFQTPGGSGRGTRDGGHPESCEIEVFSAQQSQELFWHYLS